MATFQNDAVPKFRENDLPRTVKELRNYSFNLSEQMMFLFSNLDEDNVPALNEINNRFEDVDGNITNLTINADGLKLSVQDHENRLTSLTVTVDGIKTTVSDVDGNLSSLTQTVNGISTRVGNAEGDISTLQQTANSLTVQVADNKASIATLKITSSGLESTVSDLNGKYTSLKQTVDGFDFTGFVTFTDLNNELDNYPTNSDLRRGRTSISGGCIDTDQIDVAYINLYGEMSVGEGRDGPIGGYIGFCEGNSDVGIGVMESARSGQCICTNGGAKLAYGSDDFYIGVSRSNIFASEDIYIESDRRVKQDIRYDLDTYETFYRKLKPCSFVRKRHTSGRRHTGFIAQELEEALLSSGKTGMDLAAYGFDPDARRYENNAQTPTDAEKGCYKIRYTELVALNTAMVQKLMVRVDELEQEIKRLKGGQ